MAQTVAAMVEKVSTERPVDTGALATLPSHVERVITEATQEVHMEQYMTRDGEDIMAVVTEPDQTEGVSAEKYFLAFL